MQRTTLYFPDDLHRELKLKAARHGWSMSQIAVRVLQKWLQEEWEREQRSQGLGASR